MDIADKDLIIFDLDGTLAPSKSPMHPDMGALLARLLAKKKVAVITGGAFPQFQTQFLSGFPHGNAGFSGLYLLPTSGSQLYLWKGSWTELYAERFTAKEKGAILVALKAALRAGGYVEPAKTYGAIIEDRESQITFSGLGQNAPLELKEQWDPKREKRQRILDALAPKIPQFDARLGGTTTIDITRRGVNKAYGIHKLEHFLNIPIARMLFVGDALYYGGNDYPAKTTGADCVQVSGPDETKRLIEGWCA